MESLKRQRLRFVVEECGIEPARPATRRLVLAVFVGLVILQLVLHLSR